MNRATEDRQIWMEDIPITDFGRIKVGWTLAI